MWHMLDSPSKKKWTDLYDAKVWMAKKLKSNVGPCYNEQVIVAESIKKVGTLILHSKVPLIAFLALTQLRIPPLRSVLGRGRWGNQRSIPNRAVRELHAIGLKQLTDLSIDRCTNLAHFQQVAEIKQDRRIGHSFTPKINPVVVTKCGIDIQSIFTRFVSQIEPIGELVHSNHSHQTHRRASIPHHRVIQFDQRCRTQPTEQDIHTLQKRHLARRFAVNLKSFDCRQCHMLHRISTYSKNQLTDHMTNGSVINYSVFP